MSSASSRSSTVDDVEAEQLLLGLGERPVDHQRRLAVLRSVVAAVVGSSRATGPSLPLAGQLLVDDVELRHHRVVLLLGPGADDVFVVVAEHGVEHGRFLV